MVYANHHRYAAIDSANDNRLPSWLAGRGRSTGDNATIAHATATIVGVSVIINIKSGSRDALSAPDRRETCLVSRIS